MKEHGTWLVADIYNGDYIDSVGKRDGWPAEVLRKNTAPTETQRTGREVNRYGIAMARYGRANAGGTDSRLPPQQGHRR
jgi:hypothetical protein